MLTFDKSRELFELAKKSHAGGVSSYSRSVEGPFPLFFERGEGAKLYDADGNELIDYVCGFGPGIFGHSPQFLVDAVTRAMQDGLTFAGQHRREIKVAQMIQRLVPCADLVRYGSSGSEVDQAAVKLARGYTGRDRVIKFEGHYHGWMDNVHYSVAPPLDEAGPDDAPVPVPVSAGVSRATAQEIIVLPWNNINALQKTLDREGHDVAAIMMEPIMFNTNCIFPRPGYLEEVRRLCDEHGVVLVFDEVIAGFRLALGGAQELLGVTPDLATFAKAAAGGFPLSILAGKREIMALIADGTVHHGGTLNSNMTCMAAAEATLEKLVENDGAVHKQLYATGNRLMEGLRQLADRHEQPMLVHGPGPAFDVSFTEAEEDEIFDYRSHVRNVDLEKYERFRIGMLERGVRLIVRGLWYVSTAHTKEDINKTLAAADEVLASL